MSDEPFGMAGVDIEDEDFLVTVGLLPGPENPNLCAMAPTPAVGLGVEPLIEHYERVMHGLASDLTWTRERLDEERVSVGAERAAGAHLAGALRWLRDVWELDELSHRVIAHALGDGG